MKALTWSLFVVIASICAILVLAVIFPENFIKIFEYLRDIIIGSITDSSVFGNILEGGLFS